MRQLSTGWWENTYVIRKALWRVGATRGTGRLPAPIHPWWTGSESINIRKCCIGNGNITQKWTMPIGLGPSRGFAKTSAPNLDDRPSPRVGFLSKSIFEWVLLGSGADRVADNRDPSCPDNVQHKSCLLCSKYYNKTVAFTKVQMDVNGIRIEEVAISWYAMISQSFLWLTAIFPIDLSVLNHHHQRRGSSTSWDGSLFLGDPLLSRGNSSTLTSTDDN